MTYSHCTDGEFFRGEFATPEEAAADAFTENPGLKEVEVGENIKRPSEYFVFADSILEDVAECAQETCGEVANEWLRNLMDDKGKKAELEKLVGGWIDANDPPQFWYVENAKTITRAELIAAGVMEKDA